MARIIDAPTITPWIAVEAFNKCLGSQSVYSLACPSSNLLMYPIKSFSSPRLQSIACVARWSKATLENKLQISYELSWNILYTAPSFEKVAIYHSKGWRVFRHDWCVIQTLRNRPIGRAMIWWAMPEYRAKNAHLPENERFTPYSVCICDVHHNGQLRRCLNEVSPTLEIGSRLDLAK